MKPSKVIQAWRNLKIKQKLILAFLLVLIVPIMIIQYFTLGALRSGMENQQKTQMEYIKNNVSDLLDEYRLKLLNYVSFLTTQQSLIDLAFITSLTSDAGRLTTELVLYHEMLDVDGLEVINMEREIIAGVGLGRDPGEVQSSNKVIDRALSGNRASEIVNESGTYYIMAAGPIFREDRPIAVVLASIILGDGLAKALKERTGSEISFEFDREIVASSFGKEKTENLFEFVEADDQQSLEVIGVNGELFSSTHQSITDSAGNEVGRVHIAVSRQEFEATKIKFRRMLITVTFFSLGIALAFGYVVSQNFAEQISLSVAFSQTVARGDLRQKIRINSGDELGLLGKSLNNMVGDLRSTVDHIQIASSNIVKATDSIDAEHLEKGSTQQAESLEATMTSISKMNASIKNVADAAEGLSHTSAESSSSILEMSASIENITGNAQSLSSIVDFTSTSVEKMISSVKDISENVDQLSLVTTETATTVTQFGLSVQGVKDNADESATLSEKVSQQAREIGSRSIQQVIQGINRIQEAMIKSSDVIHRLGERSQQVGKVLTVIDDVTRQTNLLALNAAILAAQAGKEGKSFSVVADEIKALADRTSSSTKEIAQLITSVQNEVHDAVASVQEGSKNVAEGVRLSHEARDALSEILESSNKSSEMAHAILMATIEQAQGIQSVNEATEQTSQMVRQIAGAITAHRREADQIIKSVGELRDISHQVSQATVQQTEGSRLINQAVEEVNNRAHSIAKATKEQKTGSEQIMKAANEMMEITEQNLSMASAVRKAIETLEEQAEVLQKEVKRFSI